MGGPVLGMAAYAGLLADAGYAVTVYSVKRGTDGESFALDSRVRHVQESAAGWGGFRRSPALWRQAQAAEINLIHSHGLWTDVHRLAGHLARTRKVPHLLGPCGMLMPGALRHHGWKKAPVRIWFQDRALSAAQCLHAKSNQEYKQIRAFGLRNPVAVIPNPIAPPPMLDPGRGQKTEGRDQISEVGGQKSVVRSPWSVVPGRRVVLFLGRLHPVKGLARLVRAWAGIQRSGSQWSGGQWSGGPSPATWQLVLAGPDEGGYRRELEALIAELGCRDSVVFTGELDEKQKWGALAAADLFVMPSDFENFGNAIVEAMSCGLPVITTTGTPWEELRSADAGWRVEPRVEPLAEALREALAMSEAQRRAMGKRAAGLAARFGPEQAAVDMIQVYRWLLRKIPCPSCVRLD